MMSKCHVASLVFLICITLAVGAENYMDYGEDNTEKAAENIRELYRILSQRNAIETALLSGTPIEHLMIRKSQRSPSLRLRFGRSGPAIPAGIMAVSGSASRSASPAGAFEEN